ncbi:MAG: hypothetical protein ACRD9R_00215 [Pyrinomonadaceae bacterium]
MKRTNALLATLLLTLTASLYAPVSAMTVAEVESAETEQRGGRVRAALNLAVLVQDDLVPRVGNEIRRTQDFIRALPEGSRVMIGYIRAGSLQVREPFTTDLERAAKALRIPVGSTAASPYNPYVEVIEALRKFDAQNTNPNALLLISDGLDTSHGFDYASAVNSVDLNRAVREAKRRDVAVYSFYAPSVGLTGFSRTATSAGQGALNRLSQETGGRAFFQGTSFVTFDAYFERLGRALNEKYSPIS